MQRACEQNADRAAQTLWGNASACGRKWKRASMRSLITPPRIPSNRY
jgi:hypothetical protein